MSDDKVVQRKVKLESTNKDLLTARKLTLGRKNKTFRGRFGIRLDTSERSKQFR